MSFSTVTTGTHLLVGRGRDGREGTREGGRTCRTTLIP